MPNVELNPHFNAYVKLQCFVIFEICYLLLSVITCYHAVQQNFGGEGPDLGSQHQKGVRGVTRGKILKNVHEI